MQDSARNLLQTSLDDAHLAIFASRLTAWLVTDLNKSDARTADFTESRARALLRAAGVIDTLTLNSFANLMETGAGENKMAMRLAIYDLLAAGELADHEEVVALANAVPAVEPTDPPVPVSWLVLAVAVFSRKYGYPLHQLDPVSPPGGYTPAGQLLRKTADFVRGQVLRSATERDKLGRLVAFDPERADQSAPRLQDLRPGQPVPPLPPHFRPPIPVNYPEVERETVRIDPTDADVDAAPTSTGETVTVTEDDLEAEARRMPPIQITSEQVTSSSQSQVVTPNASPPPLTSFTKAVRQRFGRREPYKSTKLNVVTEEYPDGPALYGLQVRVTCRGVRSYVAGTTNRDGRFVCRLPVRVRSGLTYDVDVTWPRDMGGEIERKSITLNADRTEFTLPFYHRWQEDEG